ncbi:hypothetical protein AAHA92_06274 [Salvia divinorum]|uniref:Uncharacterized protein n=1 Tax=Salvia divinorum TaxID=28513 RepID=A0ABD1I7R8_SALDI
MEFHLSLSAYRDGTPLLSPRTVSSGRRSGRAAVASELSPRWSEPTPAPPRIGAASVRHSVIFVVVCSPRRNHAASQLCRCRGIARAAVDGAVVGLTPCGRSRTAIASGLVSPLSSSGGDTTIPVVPSRLASNLLSAAPHEAGLGAVIAPPCISAIATPDRRWPAPIASLGRRIRVGV